jgi:hypothetical protein
MPSTDRKVIQAETPNKRSDETDWDLWEVS